MYQRPHASFPGIRLFSVTCAEVVCVIFLIAVYVDHCFPTLFPVDECLNFSYSEEPLRREKFGGQQKLNAGRRLCNSAIRTTDSVQLNMTVNVNVPKHRRSWWRTDITAVMPIAAQKSPRYFVGCLEFSAVFQNCYLFYDLSRNSGWEH
jgi:hypothetical protein